MNKYLRMHQTNVLILLAYDGPMLHLPYDPGLDEQLSNATHVVLLTEGYTVLLDSDRIANMLQRARDNYHAEQLGVDIIHEDNPILTFGFFDGDPLNSYEKHLLLGKDFHYDVNDLRKRDTKTDTTTDDKHS